MDMKVPHRIAFRLAPDEPRELFNAMGFPSDYVIDIGEDGKPVGRTVQVARCGNAVSPVLAEAVVRANMFDLTESV